jgi:hypothetical protein
VIEAVNNQSNQSTCFSGCRAEAEAIRIDLLYWNNAYICGRIHPRKDQDNKDNKNDNNKKNTPPNGKCLLLQHCVILLPVANAFVFPLLTQQFV